MHHVKWGGGGGWGGGGETTAIPGCSDRGLISHMEDSDRTVLMQYFLIQL